MTKRAYAGEADLELLQDFNAAAITQTNHCGFLRARGYVQTLQAARFWASNYAIWHAENGLRWDEIRYVAHFGKNEAARRMYQTRGFSPWHVLDGFKKHL